MENNKDLKSAIISPKLLKTLSEGALLELAKVIYRADHPNEKTLLVFADAIGKTHQHLIQAINDECCIGTASWIKIQELINRPIFYLWLESQTGCIIEFHNK